MPAVDLKKQIESYRAARGRVDLITVPPLSFLMVDGHGDPNTAPEYRDAVGALYPLAYKLKFFSKRELGRDHTVMPLEALWTADDMDVFTSARDKSRWDWTAMIMVPDWITAEHVEAARETARASATDALDAVRFEIYDEGLSVQTLHVGPYDAEAPVLDELHNLFIPENGLRMTGRHHEIYLGDPRRSAPEKLRTILRQPVERAV
ncbi:hypothetical protein DY023_03950 [Microbacterium bovistercoris]|uniref:GyrI-like small molecule binding domain-containing protein n=1 Tax=Microbacterium bovistercoris TaxID=2293570 RepID=A0A371NXL8_9MICO|nr:GyrI-like domain-containing protein [Microbacterium bovistercoris]REJ07360.1 hypothetical protein DY023_03950 [Microbacterium bovistercoris]